MTDDNISSHSDADVDPMLDPAHLRAIGSSMPNFCAEYFSDLPLTEGDIDEIANILGRWNDAYRNGEKEVDDHIYDTLKSRLTAVAPDHPYLKKVEPEAFCRPEFRHTTPMLSIDNAFDDVKLEAFLARVESAATALGIDPDTVQMRGSPKLDGMAGRVYVTEDRSDGMLQDRYTLVSRGDGAVGYDISHLMDLGLLGVTGPGNGEIVVTKPYFDGFLSKDVLGKEEGFAHPRGVVVGLANPRAEKPNLHVQKALKTGAIWFLPYADLPTAWEGSLSEFRQDKDAILEGIAAYGHQVLLDGIVLEVADTRVKAAMGATASTVSWAIAIKAVTEIKKTTVMAVDWQVGRTGKVTPVLRVEPTRISGAVVSNITAHNATLAVQLGVGPGAVIEAIRSGEVIPKVHAVATPAPVTLPKACPACGSPLVMGETDLVCESLTCPAQQERRTLHFFQTLGVDGFGPKAIHLLNMAGRCTPETIVELSGDLKANLATAEAWARAGFGPGQAANLVRELQRLRTEPVEDWKLLAALGFKGLGRGDSRNLLQHFKPQELVEATPAAIAAIDGFGETTAQLIVCQVAKEAHRIAWAFNGLFNVKYTEAPKAGASGGIIGKGVVFTGGMQSGSREEMEEQARGYGAKVQSGVSKKTDYLVVGTDPGATKMNKAKALGTKVLTESEYLALLRGER